MRHVGLPLLKRYVELRQMETGHTPADNGRGYLAGDAALGCATAVRAVPERLFKRLHL